MRDHETLIGWADALTHMITELELAGLLAAAAPATWQRAGECLRSGEAAEQLLGYRLLLAALAETPGGALALIERLALALAGRGWES